MGMTVNAFVEKFKKERIANTKTDNTIVPSFIKKELEVREYVPFKEKRAIVELLVMKSIDVVDGVKKHDSISGYVSFVAAMLTAHTNLELSDHPIADYDVLAENKLLAPIIETFRESYDECDVLLKMALASELEDNNVNMLFGRFLNGILDRLDSVGEVLKSTMGNVDINAILGEHFKQEDITKLLGFLDKFNK
jgi:hypothetical protein